MRLKKLNIIEFFIFLFIIIIFSFCTYKRNFVWKDEIALWSDVLKKAPNKWRVHSEWGRIYGKQGLLKKSEEEYKKAILLNPYHKHLHYELAVFNYNQKKYDNAKIYFENVIKFDPKYGDAHYYLGNIYFKMNLYNKATKEYELALRSNIYTNIPIEDIWYNLGLSNYVILSKNKKIQEYRSKLKSGKKLYDSQIEKEILNYKTNALKYFKMITATNDSYKINKSIRQYIKIIEETY